MRRFFIILFFGLIAFVAQTTQARKFALLVGVDEYENVPSLECCVNDMKTLKEALLKVGFEENDIQMLVTGGKYKDFPKKTRIEEKIADILSQAQPTDMIFIALSGHGAQEGGKVYFCPPDVETDDLAGTSVSITKIMDDLASSKAKFKWMVVDACRNDPTQGPKGIGGKGLQIIPTPPAGIALFQSCAEGEESWEDRDSGNGYFTKNFAAALSGEADANHDGKLTLMEVCSWTTAHTKEQVKTSQNKSQRPYFSGSVSDFTLTEDLNVPKAKALIAEARQAKEDDNYELAVKKYDEAIALCPRFDDWKYERRDAQRFLDANHKFDPMKIVVPDNVVSVAEAYAKVKDGGTIELKPGRYELSETLVVDRSVTFRGSFGLAEDVSIDCPTADAFKITGGSPSFQNLTVSSGGEKCSGFYITSGTPKLFRCIITSRKGSGVCVEGEKANPEVKSCVVKGCERAGVYVIEKGLGTFVNCDFYKNSPSGVVARYSGNPTVTGCRIHDGKYFGIFVLDEGLGSFSDCDIYNNDAEGISVCASGNPIFSECRIYNGKTGGVLVSENSLGTFKDCKIYRNAGVGFLVSKSSDPTVTGCKIYEEGEYGILVSEKGLGKFSDCEIYKTNLGVGVCDSSNPTLTGCKISDGKSFGIYVFDDGLGLFNDCEIFGNDASGISVSHSGNPTITKCKIHDGKSCGIYVWEKGSGSFNDCEIYQNASPGIMASHSGNPTITNCKIHDGKDCGVVLFDGGLGTFNENTFEKNYNKDGDLENWHIESSAGEVKGSGNTPSIPTK